MTRKRLRDSGSHNRQSPLKKRRKIDEYKEYEMEKINKDEKFGLNNVLLYNVCTIHTDVMN